MRKLYSTLAVLCCAVTLQAQNVNYSWARGISEGEPTSIKADAAGNVYTLGYFHGTVDFDPGPGVSNLTVVGGFYNTFLTKTDALGNFVWAKSISGGSGQTPSSLVIDASGNPIAIGLFTSSADFDPGPATNTLSSSNGGTYVWKLDASGNLVWAKQLPGYAQTTSPAGTMGDVMAIDPAGNIVIGGAFSGPADFDPGPGTAILTGSGGYVCKWDGAGNFVWAKKFDGADAAVGPVALDALGNIYAGGIFSTTMDVDPGPGTTTFTCNGFIDIFIAKLDPSGNYLWGKQIGGIDEDYVHNMLVNASGDVVLNGYFMDAVDFDPGPGTYIISAPFDGDYLLKLDAAGNFIWAKLLAIPSPAITCAAIDAAGSIYYAGQAPGTVDMDPGPGVYYFGSASSPFSYYVSKVSPAGDLMWAAPFGGGGQSGWLKTMTVDASYNVITSGTFNGVFDADPTSVVNNITVTGPNVMFTTKWGQDVCANMVLTADSLQFINCSNNTGLIDVSASGGSVPYSYTWNTTPPVNDTVLIPTAGGLYSVTATDAAGCTRTSTYVMNNYSPLPGFDLFANMATHFFVPGFDHNIWLNAGNNACVPTTGSLKLVVPSIITVNTVYPTPSSVNGDTLTWNFSNLTFDSPHITPMLNVTTNVTATIGDTACFTVIIDPVTGDNDPSNNIKQYCSAVVSSWDPNDIAVSPRGACDEGYVVPGTTLTYTTRFQNTGTFQATNIYVLDTLDADLNINTVQIMGSSHDMITEVLPGNVLKFRFDNINLPDSNANEPMSHGYLIYEIDHNASVPDGTEILNSADIYFDFNPAVVTNTVKNTIITTIPSCNPLAVDLVYFNGQLVDNTTQLNWQIGDEKGISSYGVERSFDGSGFTAIGKVTATNGKVYQFTDNNLEAATVAYYRLKVNRVNGKHDYSNIIRVQLNGKSGGFSVHPNPATNIVSLTSVMQMEEASIKLMNAMGQVVLTKDNLIGNETSFDISTLAKGVYVMEIMNGSEVSRIKVVKQ